MKIPAQLAGRTRLTIAEAGELFGVAEQTFDLETRFVIPVDRLGGQRNICAEEQCMASSGQVTHHHQVKIVL